jgi:Fe2+ or Zn2+ uptake regulation protein
MKDDVAALLRSHGIHPTAQRVAVGAYVLRTEDHPSADEAWARVRRKFPMISRATVYNTLRLFERKGLVVALNLAEGKVVFDPRTGRHHHFIDEASGRIYDLPWDALQVRNVEGLRGFRVKDYQVVLRGRRMG